MIPASKWRAWTWWLIPALVLVAGALWQLATPNGDLFQYRCYALAFWQGDAATQVAGCVGRLPVSSFAPLHIVPREYPPLALVPFSLPLLLGGASSMTAYVLAFNALMLACLVATGWLLLRDGPVGFGNPAAARWFALWIALGATTIALVRFDALPALLVVAGLGFARTKPDWRAYLLLTAGTLLKLYPALLLVSVAIWDWRRREGNSASRSLWWSGPLAALASGGVLQFAVNRLAGTTGIPWLGVQSSRPPQIESTAAALLWLGNVLAGRAGTIHAISAEHALALPGAAGRPLGTLTLAVALLSIAWGSCALLGGWLDFWRASTGALLALLAGAAIFSPQYLVWVTPLVALTLATMQAKRRQLLILAWTAICLLTTIVYSVGYLLGWPTAMGVPLGFFMVLVCVRDGLVWYCAGILLLPTRRDAAVLVKQRGDTVSQAQAG